MSPATTRSAAAAAARVDDPAQALLRERERATLRVLTAARLLLLAIMLPASWLLGSSMVDRTATTALLGVYAIGLIASAMLLRRAASLTLAGLVGAGLDVILIGTLPLIWYVALGGDTNPTGVLLKSSLTVIALLLVVMNALAVRPLYPAIVTAGALGVHGILLILAFADGKTSFTSSYLVAYTTPAVSGDAIVTRFLVLALSGAVLTYLAHRTRCMVIGAVALQRTNDQLGRYFSPNLVSRIAGDPTLLHLDAERRELSFVFTDLAGFTGLVEATDPEKLVPVLNGYLEALVQVAFHHDGTVDKVVGDAVHVIFGAPVVQPDHAARAVACALEMDAVAERFRHATGVPLGVTRIGVSSGEAVVGNFGGESLFDYTAHGDAINVTARLESANRHLGTRILVSRNTADRIPRFAGRPVGTLKVVGKHEGIEVCEPLTESTTDAIDSYLAAFDALHDGAPDALSRFEAHSNAYPNDALARFHVERLRRGAHGVEIELTSK